LEVSDFAQTPAADGHRLSQPVEMWDKKASRQVRRVSCRRLMSSGNMQTKRRVGLTDPKIEKEKEALLDLVRTWTQAASYRESIEKGAPR
jgi:hypothetical protein